MKWEYMKIESISYCSREKGYVYCELINKLKVIIFPLMKIRHNKIIKLYTN